MDRKAQKKAAQKALNMKSRHARFISEYVQRRHPNIYAEGCRFYNTLKAANPEKRDLTKTHAFLVETTNYVDYRDFYNRKRLKSYRKRITTTTTTTRVDNMELNIQLMTPETVVENKTMQVMPNNVYEDLLSTINADPDLKSIFDGMTDPQAEHALEDPILKEILDDTPLEKGLFDGMTDPQAEHALEDPILKEIVDDTPLEKELNKMGYN